MLLWMGGGFMALAAVFLSIAWLIAEGGRSLRGQTAEATAVVTGYATGYSGSTTMYAVKFQFRPAGSDAVVKKVAGTRTSWQPYALGDRVLVQYDPDDPADASVKGSGKFLAYGFLAMGLIFLLVGGGLVFMGVR